MNHYKLSSADTRKALLVAIIVGSVLLVINQLDALQGHSDFRIVPAILTYIVPFLVFIVGKISK